MAGSVFSKIAERVYAKNLRFDIRSAIDSTTNVIPTVKAGEMNEALYVLDALDVQAIDLPGGRRTPEPISFQFVAALGLKQRMVQTERFTEFRSRLGAIAVNDLTVHGVRHEIFLPVMRDESAEAFTEIDNLELRPQIH